MRATHCLVKRKSNNNIVLELAENKNIGKIKKSWIGVLVFQASGASLARGAFGSFSRVGVSFGAPHFSNSTITSVELGYGVS